MKSGAGTVKDMPTAERPREKLMRYGAGRLSDEEVLAVLLRTGSRGENALSLAGRIMRQLGREGLAGAEHAALSSIRGVGPVRACAVLAALEAGRRLLKGNRNSVYLKPRDVWEEMKDIRCLRKEHFVIFFLDTRNQEIKREIISIGCLNASLVHPREVFEPAVRNLAAGIIASHNHPSGSLEPSQEDLELTKRLAAAGKLMGIELLDHVIVTGGGYASFREKGLL